MKTPLYRLENHSGDVMKLFRVLLILLAYVSIFTTALCQETLENLIPTKTARATSSDFSGFYRKVVEGKLALYHISDKETPIYKDFNGTLTDTIEGGFYRKFVNGKMALYLSLIHISEPTRPY